MKLFAFTLYIYFTVHTKGTELSFLMYLFINFNNLKRVYDPDKHPHIELRKVIIDITYSIFQMQ